MPGAFSDKKVVCQAHMLLSADNNMKMLHTSDARIIVIKDSFTLYFLRRITNRRFITDGNSPFNV